MQLDLQSGAVHPLANRNLVDRTRPPNTTPPTALMYRWAVHRPTHAFLPTVTMFWPHSCRLGRQNWRTGGRSHGPKFFRAAAPHHAAARSAAAPVITLSKIQWLKTLAIGRGKHRRRPATDGPAPLFGGAG